MIMGVIGGVMVAEVMTVQMMGTMMRRAMVRRRRLVGRCTPSIRDTADGDGVPDLPLGPR
jgi:hypothetical protein